MTIRSTPSGSSTVPFLPTILQYVPTPRLPVRLPTTTHTSPPHSAPACGATSTKDPTAIGAAGHSTGAAHHGTLTGSPTLPDGISDPMI